MQAVYQWMKELTYFMLFVGLVRNLTGKKYEKYAKLTVGLCMVALLASPLAGLIKKGDLASILKKNEFVWEISEEVSENGVLEERVLKEYKSRMTQQLQEVLKKWEVKVTGLEFEISEGMLCGFTVWVQKAAEKQAKEQKGISVTDIIVSLDTEKKKSVQMAELLFCEEEIKNTLADFYRLDTEHIHVVIGGTQDVGMDE